MEKVTLCPICDGSTFKTYLTVKDHSISKETFEITECKNCQLLATNPRPSVDQLGQYYISEEYVSHSGNAKSFFDSIYMLVRSFTLKWKHKLLQSKNKDLKILDYGCGAGDFLAYCKQKGMIVYGLEPSNLARKLAEEKIGIQIAQELNQLSVPVDRITLWHVLEHIPDINSTLEKLKSLLKPEGYILIAVPNHKSLDAEIYKDKWAAYDVPRHLWHFSKKNIETLAIKHSLKVDKTIPMHLDSFYVSMLSEKYKSGKTGISAYLKGILNGLKSNLKARKTTEYSSLIYVLKNDI